MGRSAACSCRPQPAGVAASPVSPVSHVSPESPESPAASARQRGPADLKRWAMKRAALALLAALVLAAPDVRPDP
ncbi:MAG: hypothetical protein ACRELB_05580, partial [Polyangiaceae bacterium]